MNEYMLLERYTQFLTDLETKEVVLKGTWAVEERNVDLIETEKNLNDTKEVVLKGTWAVEGRNVDLIETVKNLNDVKAKTGKFVHRKNWRFHTEWCHALGKNVTFNFGNPTRAYLKMSDLLRRFPKLLSGKYPKFRSLHLCESPGNFVAAIGDFLDGKSWEWKMNSLNPWEWKMNSLNPYFEWNSPDLMLNEDALIIVNESRMFFGTGNSGDIFKFKKEDFENIGKMDLVTADGSFDCTFDPEKQEEMVGPLISREAFLALNALDSGGNLVIKMFTFFLEKTKEILMKLVGSFEEVYIRKPAPSKPGNSEVYVICLNYSGQIQMDNTEETIKKINVAAEYFALKQAEAIELNLDLLDTSQFLRCQIDDLKHSFATDYFDKLPEPRFWNSNASIRPIFLLKKERILPQTIQLNSPPFLALDWLKSRRFVVVPKDSVTNGPITNPVFGFHDPDNLKLDFCQLAGQKIPGSDLPPSSSVTLFGLNPWTLAKRDLINKIMLIMADAERVFVSVPPGLNCGILSRFSISCMAILMDVFELDGLPDPGDAIRLKRYRNTSTMTIRLLEEVQREQMISEVLCFVPLNVLSDNFRQFIRFYNGWNTFFQ
uniref:Cap-specific mRNA (nucleoside-2'-O-)-methyltransferase 2 n=1 Tax=Panagrolaimus sp. JU765 TaxID=591449 RepID=A0AC34RIW9_9BILA